MKKLINDPRAVVREMLEGQVDLHPGQALLETENVIVRADLPPPGDRQVALISGGGSGHEPAHAGYVGTGLLHAAVAGDVFTSPSVDAVLSAIRAVGGPAGAILIVKNYTGDIFHFHLAAEKARAKWGLRVEVLVVGDDVAVGRKKSGKVGRRGLAGTVLVHKILGALSAEGKSIDELLATGRAVVDGLVTCGVSQGHVHIPGTKLEEEEPQLELGMGIHNEPGCYVLDPRPSLDELIDKMLDMLLNADDTDRAYVNFEGQNPVLLVNNLGGVSQLEHSALVQHTVAKLGALP